MQTSSAPIEPQSHRTLTIPPQQPVPLLVNVQCGPKHVSRNQLVDFLRSQKRTHPGFRVIDVGGSANPYPPDLVTAILDIQKPMPDSGKAVWYPGNIDSPEGWREVEAAVMTSGPFDFAICSHTLEDVGSPSMICGKLSRIARMGYIAIPSKYKELSRFETSPPSYRGYIHHRWIFSVRDNQFWGYPKLNFLDHDPYFDRFTGPDQTQNDQLSFWWKNAIDLQIVNGGYLGLSPPHVMDYYRKGLTDDDLDRRNPGASGSMGGSAAGATSPDSATRADSRIEESRPEAEAFFGRHLSVMERCVKAGGSDVNRSSHEDCIDETAETVPVNLFINFYQDKDPMRYRELEECFRRNVSNHEINKIYVLCNDQDASLLQGVGSLNKLIVIKHEGRPTYKEIFDQVNQRTGTKQINIVSNTDMYFDSSLIHIQKIGTDDCYLLSRWEVGCPFQVQSRGDSQDVWIFRGPVKPVAYADFTLGIPGCDNRIAYELQEAGYRVLNPSRTIKAWHLHLSNIRYNLNEIPIPRPYLWVEPIAL